MKIKTNELIGPALDWAVSVCENRIFSPLASSQHYFSPSTVWAQGGPIIERGGICIRRGHSGWWIAYKLDAIDDEQHMQIHSTLLIAAMHCYVASKLGEEVEIPEELI